MAQIDDFDVADFRQSVAKNTPTEAVRHAIYELLSFAENYSDRIKGGAAKLGSFQYQINVKNRTLSLFTCDACGYISVSLGNFACPHRQHSFLYPWHKRRIVQEHPSADQHTSQVGP